MPLDLSILNDEQLLPVMDTQGAVLVTAGAGSGKTRLLTHRIAHLICNLNVSPYNILAITFTNKAAKEMKERLNSMLPSGGADGVFVSTFHAMCAYILRRYINKLGYSTNFSIYDEDEKKKTIKAVAAQIDKQSDTLHSGISLALSTIKNLGKDILWYSGEYNYLPDIDNICEGVAKYTNAMKNNSALDFDDLLYLTYNLVTTDKECYQYLIDRFKYIHVDEFQDTNVIQYKIVKILSSKHKNLFAVGDEDQSIYGWRGANINNIKDFINETNCKIYKLEQNYRSSKNIISLANNIIKNNNSRIEKKLWTNNADGLKPHVFLASGDLDEADFVMQTIKSLKGSGNSYSSIAVLMRVNALSRSLEQKFAYYGIPYKIYGGFKFFDRKEVKDALAYLKLLINSSDNEAAIRVINFPKKGIGTSSIDKMVSLANTLNVQLYDIIMGSTEQSEIFDTVKSSLGNALINKLNVLNKQLLMLQKNSQLTPSLLLKYLYNLLQLDQVFSSGSEEDESRKLNLKELIKSVLESERLNPNLTVSEYVQQIMLLTDLDSEDEGDCVNIYTIHSAKGLEFDTVFIVGVEEGLFPLSKAISDPNELEEERRLMYVAVTRAKKRLFLSYTTYRYLYNSSTRSSPSRFLIESGLVKNPQSNNYYSFNKNTSDDFFTDNEAKKSKNAEKLNGSSNSFVMQSTLLN